MLIGYEAILPLALTTGNTTNRTPKEWSEANIILIHKKGDPKNISNYRPIGLLPNIYKLFSSMINNRLSPIIEAKQPIEQSGFRKGYSTIDHIHTIELIIEKYQELQRPLYITFIDYQKAFDSVTHSSIWESLKEHEVPDIYINIIKSIYNTNIGRIKLETLGPALHIERGVRQGDPLSSTIFIAILESLMNGLDWSKTVLHIKGAHLNHLRFADDLTLLSETVNEMQSMTESLQKASREMDHKSNPVERTTRQEKEGGRPLTRWEEDLKRSAGSDWYSIAQDRQKWASLEEAFTQTGSLVDQ
ncbi:Retrovirus-related Pol polyprotein from type-1 retrotransposable element R2 [Eumeta japonica]|uniref:Retrovirus-related Pol polyprotein from type-1 retrotransposable element R2 n=1 Tax=Eumeta variegata TaxID=151549 RepID=A0A4C1VKX7_EUMVA|nr:Retrovirus-related Pol polyprotein from type-1 retrotransposable element R2 [Eumeta japonica]